MKKQDLSLFVLCHNNSYNKESFIIGTGSNLKAGEALGHHLSAEGRTNTENHLLKRKPEQKATFGNTALAKSLPPFLHDSAI